MLHIKGLLLFMLVTSLMAENRAYFVYHCDHNYSYVAEVSEKEAWLFLPCKTVQTLAKQEGENKYYVAKGVSYKLKGFKSELTVDQKYYNCLNDGIEARFEKAKFDGVLFRAIGNEPGWILEFLSDKEVLLITNLGQNRTTFTVEERYEAKNSTEYRLKSKHNSLYIRIENSLCFDTMVDRSYESRVYLNFDGHELRGCGKALY